MDLVEAGQAAGRASLNLIQQVWDAESRARGQGLLECGFSEALPFLVPLLTERGPREEVQRIP